VRLYGTQPNWRVEIDPPVITNQKPAPADTSYEPSDTLPDGQMLRIEHAADGFDAKVVRRVYKGDQVITYENDEHYDPAQDVVLVGSSTGELPPDFVPPE
jgi:hypothetical protein